MADRSFFDYVGAAFKWQWNLLALGTGVVFGFLCGRPDIVLPLVGAAELTYLGLVATNVRFQKAVDASRMELPDPAAGQQAELGRIMAALGQDDLARFQALRSRCVELRKLSEQYRGGPATGSQALSRMRTDSLDRLLWMFLKLLYSKDALDRFLQATDRDGLARDIGDTEARIASATDAGRSDKLLRSLQDKLETVRQRLGNYDSAEENSELTGAELDRIEQKIAAVSEMSLSAGGADISAEVDGITAGISATKDVFGGLDIMPTLTDDSAPPLLQE